MGSVIRETDGIVLDSRDHGESDLIISLFNRDRGRTAVIAKGAKKSKRRFVNKLELFSFLHVTLRQSGNRSLALLEEADLQAGFLSLRQNVAKYTAASVIREVLLLGTREGEENESIYRLLLWALSGLDRDQPHLWVVMCFLLRCYDYIGYRPELDSCMECGVAAPSAEGFGFSTAAGGLVCSTCSARLSASLIPLSPQTVRMLQSTQNVPLEKLHRLKIAETSIYEGLNILHRYGRHILQRDIISWKMLRQTLNWKPHDEKSSPNIT